MCDNYVFDIDGTIVLNNEILSNQKEKILNDLGKTNTIIFASSRAYRGIKSVIPESFHNKYLILCNGAIALFNKKVVARKNIEPNVCIELIHHLEKNNVPFYLEFGDGIGISSNKKNDFLDILIAEASDEYVAVDYENKLDKICKIGIVEGQSAKYYQQMIENYYEVSVYQHADGTADIVSREASKWNMYSSLGLDRKKTVAFGNDANDYEMLFHADISVAVCPENDKISSIAKYIINDYSSDSLNEMIDKIIRI